MMLIVAVLAFSYCGEKCRG